MSFQTAIDQKSISVYVRSPQGIVDSEVYGGSVKWSLDFDARSWGVKNVIPIINSFWVEGYHEEETGRSTPFNVRYPEPDQSVGPIDDPEDLNVQKPWRVEADYRGGTGIYIVSVTIDFTDNLFTAMFK